MLGTFQDIPRVRLGEYDAAEWQDELGENKCGCERSQHAIAASLQLQLQRPMAVTRRVRRPPCSSSAAVR